MNNGRSAYLFSNNEHGDDAYLIQELGKESVLDAVLDGVSTGKGSVASQLTVEKLKNCKIKSLEDITKCLETANKELFKETQAYSLTTLTACLKIGNQLYSINTGDSPAYLVRNGKMDELTMMDKLPGDLVTITNAVGIGPEFAYHTKKIQLKPGDKLILITDGISDNCYPEEIEAVMKEETSDQAIETLKQLVQQKQNSNKGREDRFGHFKPDDATAIIRYFY